MKQMWRTSRDVRPTAMTQQQHNKIMPHDEFMKRIRKTLYVGGAPSSASSMANCQRVSRPLAHYAAEIFSESHKGHSLNRLNAVTITNMNSTPCSLILAMIYLDRLQDSDPMFPRRITPTELFLVSMLVSTKFYSGYDEDVFVSEWAEGTTMTSARLKQLELEFLCALNWNLYVSNGEFFDKLQSVEMALARQQGVRRGWLTYTELTQLIPSLAIAKTFLQYSTVFAVSYAASVFTIAGAFLLASQVPGTALHSGATSPSTTSKCSEVMITANDTSRETDSSTVADNKHDHIDTNSPDELFNRLQCNQLQDEDLSASPSYTFGNASMASVLVDMVQLKLHQNIDRSGINLRSFLDGGSATDDNDGDGDAINATDVRKNSSNWNVMDGIRDALGEATCQANKYGQLLQWVRFI